MADGAKDTLLAVLEAGARKLHEKTGGQLIGRLSCDVAVGAHGHFDVRYWARVGDSFGPLASLSVHEMGATPAEALETAMNACDKKNLSRKIRVHFLEEMAKELGFEVVAKKGDR